MRRLLLAPLFAALLLVLGCASSTAGATTTPHAWMIGSHPLALLNQADPTTAHAFFGSASSFVIGRAIPGYAATQATHYSSYADMLANPASTHWVILNIEKSPGTPLAEEENPGLYMAKGAALAHARGEQVIMVPGQDLMDVSTAVCHHRSGETIAQAYIRCGLPRLASVGDVVEIESQGDQLNPTEFAWIVNAGKAQVPASTPVWAGLTTDRGDPVADMVTCFNAVQGTVQGFWLNTTGTTISTADQFLRSINP